MQQGEGTMSKISLFTFHLCYFAVLQTVLRLNYKSVTKSCVFTGHFIQNTLHLGTVDICSDSPFLCLKSSKYTLGICTSQF